MAVTFSALSVLPIFGYAIPSIISTLNYWADAIFAVCLAALLLVRLTAYFGKDGLWTRLEQTIVGSMLTGVALFALTALLIALQIFPVPEAPTSLSDEWGYRLSSLTSTTLKFAVIGTLIEFVTLAAILEIKRRM